MLNQRARIAQRALRGYSLHDQEALLDYNQLNQGYRAGAQRAGQDPPILDHRALISRQLLLARRRRGNDEQSQFRSAEELARESERINYLLDHDLLDHHILEQEVLLDQQELNQMIRLADADHALHYCRALAD